MHWYYGLDENKNVFPINRMDTLKYYEDMDLRRVGLDSVSDYDVSTVFLVMNHGFHRTPILFETMVSKDGEFLDFQDRYSTWSESVLGHDFVIKHLKRSLKIKKWTRHTGVLTSITSQVAMICGVLGGSWYFWSGLTTLLLSCWLICKNDLRPVL